MQLKIRNKLLFIPGFQRCGSTYLAHLLNKQNEINIYNSIPESKLLLKDINYFNFQNKKNEIIGEKVTSYIENKNILNYFNKNLSIKIIVILREPISRAISHFNYSKKNNFEKLNFYQCFKNEKERKNKFYKTSMNPYIYFSRGRYHKYLNKLNLKNFKIVILEDLISNKDIYYELCEWIGIKKIKKLRSESFKKKVNSAKKNIKLSKNFYKLLTNFYEDTFSILETRYNLELKNWYKIHDNFF